MKKPNTLEELKKNPKLYEEFLRQKMKFGVTFKNFISQFKTAGRKPVEDKKIRVVLFFNESRIQDKGGMDKFKRFIYDCTNDK